MKDATVIPGFENYQITEKGKVISINSGKEVPATNGKVRLYDKPKHKVTLVVEELVKEVFGEEEKPRSAPESTEKAKETTTNGKKSTTKTKSGMSDKIRELYKDGMSRKNISKKLERNQGYVDNVVYRMNYAENKEAIETDLRLGKSEKEVQEKYDISARFTARVDV